ncbi:MAG: sialidase family protein [Vicinamibacterales bacterium]
MAIDSSASAYRGRAYAVCYDGPRSGPYLMRSSDGGDRWSDPMAIPKTAPADENAQRQVASIAVNRDGIVAVSWHDRGPDVSSRCWEVMIAFSGDGGESFTDPHRVSTKPSCPAAGANGYAAEFLPTGGHYSGLASAADGSFRLLWADSRGERYELRTARVSVAVRR